MSERIKILHLEDALTDAELIHRRLKKENLHFEAMVVDNKSDYIKALNTYSPDIILSDHSLPYFNSNEALDILLDLQLGIPFVLVTATVSEEFAADIVKRGAADYVLKDRPQRLPGVILKEV